MRLGILEIILCVYVCVIVEGMYTCDTGHLETRLCVYVFIVVECMYICKTGNFGKTPLCLYLCYYRVYVQM